MSSQVAASAQMRVLRQGFAASTAFSFLALLALTSLRLIGIGLLNQRPFLF